MMSEEASAAAAAQQQQLEPTANAPPPSPPPSAAEATEEEMQFDVKLVGQREETLHPMRMPPSATVCDLKAVIKAKLLGGRSSAFHVRVCGRGAVRNTRQTLGAAGINEGCTIYVQPAGGLGGGGGAMAEAMRLSESASGSGGDGPALGATEEEEAGKEEGGRGGGSGGTACGEKEELQFFVKPLRQGAQPLTLRLPRSALVCELEAELQQRERVPAGAFSLRLGTGKTLLRGCGQQTLEAAGVKDGCAICMKPAGGLRGGGEEEEKQLRIAAEEGRLADRAFTTAPSQAPPAGWRMPSTSSDSAERFR